MSGRGRWAHVCGNCLAATGTTEAELMDQMRSDYLHGIRETARLRATLRMTADPRTLRGAALEQWFIGAVTGG